MSFAIWAPLLAYPKSDYHRRVRECVADSDSASLKEFAATIDGLPVAALQELFTQTFDWNPDTTLDIGWHLFGENYDRGDFLVKLQDALRTYGLQETGELPDHLSHVLLLLDRMPEEERVTFASGFLAPALAKLCEGLGKTESPFLAVVAAIRDCVSAIVPENIVAGAAHE